MKPLKGRYNRLVPIPMRHIQCARCGVAIATRSSLRKYCTECIRINKIEAATRRRARRNNGPLP